MQVTKVAQWINGNKRKSILDHLTDGIYSSRRQVFGITFHDLIAQLLQDDVLEEIFHDQNYEIHKDKIDKNKLRKLILELLPDRIDYFPIPQNYKIELMFALNKAFYYILGDIVKKGEDLIDLIEDPPYQIEHSVEKEFDGKILRGKLDLFFNGKYNEIIDWKFKLREDTIRYSTTHSFQLYLYELLLGLDVNKRILMYASPNGVRPEERAPGNQEQLNKGIKEYSAEYNKIDVELAEAQYNFQNQWIEGLEQLENRISTNQENLDKVEELISTQIDRTLDNIEMDPILFSIANCEKCYQNCKFRRFCGKNS